MTECPSFSLRKIMQFLSLLEAKGHLLSARNASPWTDSTIPAPLEQLQEYQEQCVN